MNDVFGMNEMDGLGQLNNELKDNWLGQHTVFFDKLIQVASLT